MDQWSLLAENRREIEDRYPKVWDLPLIKKEMDRLRSHLKEGVRILEVGAGDRRFGKRILQIQPEVVYKSMDIDKRTHQDYYNLDQIGERFDLIFMFEVIEHLSTNEALQILRRIGDLLDTGGTLLIGTPNVYHPNRYFKDITHKTPFSYGDLGAVMRIAGFRQIRFFRMYNESFFKRMFRLRFGIWLHKFLEIDFAKTLLAEGIKGN